MTPENLLKNRIPEEFADAAVLTNAAGRDLLSRLDLVTLQPNQIVEVGCAAGTLTAALRARYPNAEIHAFDTDQAMLDFARQKNLPRVNWCCNSPSILPLKEKSVDLLIANLVLPWCSDSAAVLSAWRRVLRPDGLLMLTSLGLDTLCELQHSPCTLPHLQDMHNLGDSLAQAGFLDPVMDVDYFTVTYRDQAKLFHELKITGMAASADAQAQLAANAEKIFPLTFEIIFGHAWGPGVNVDHTADEAGVVKIPVSHILRR